MAKNKKTIRMVWGVGGSGKSTHSYELSEVLNIPRIHCDCLGKAAVIRVLIESKTHKDVVVDGFNIDFLDDLVKQLPNCKFLHTICYAPIYFIQHRQRFKNRSIFSNKKMVDDLYIKIIDKLKKHKHKYVIYDTSINEYIDSIVLFRNIEKYAPPVLEDHIQFEKTITEKPYHTIDLLHKRIEGVTPAAESWSIISNMINDWNGLSVIDIGSQNGYFCFKIHQRGAESVRGLDNSDDYVATSRKLAYLNQEPVSFEFTDISEEKIYVPRDVTLCLNTYHWLKNKVFALKNIFDPLKTKWVIMEINKEHFGEIDAFAKSEGFKLDAKQEGRTNRFIVKWVRELCM